MEPGMREIIIDKKIEGKSIILNVNIITGRTFTFNIDNLIETLFGEEKTILKSLVDNGTIAINEGIIKIKYPLSDSTSTYEIINWETLKYLYKDKSSDPNIINLLKAMNSLRKITLECFRLDN